MPEWMIWMALIWVFFAIRGRHGCGWGRWDRGLARGRHRYAVGTPGDPVQPGHGWSARSRPRHAPADRAREGVRRPRESAEERLQRQFVEGRLTIEEYEAALWQEIGPGR